MGFSNSKCYRKKSIMHESILMYIIWSPYPFRSIPHSVAGWWWRSTTWMRWRRRSPRKGRSILRVPVPSPSPMGVSSHPNLPLQRRLRYPGNPVLHHRILKPLISRWGLLPKKRAGRPRKPERQWWTEAGSMYIPGWSQFISLKLVILSRTHLFIPDFIRSIQLIYLWSLFHAIHWTPLLLWSVEIQWFHHFLGHIPSSWGIIAMCRTHGLVPFGWHAGMRAPCESPCSCGLPSLHQYTSWPTGAKIPYTFQVGKKSRYSHCRSSCTQIHMGH